VNMSVSRVLAVQAFISRTNKDIDHVRREGDRHLKIICEHPKEEHSRYKDLDISAKI
jgi:hypothetical protein